MFDFIFYQSPEHDLLHIVRFLHMSMFTQQQIFIFYETKAKLMGCIKNRKSRQLRYLWPVLNRLFVIQTHFSSHGRNVRRVEVKSAFR